MTSLSLSDDDSLVFSGSLDGTVRGWDLRTGDFVREISFGAPVLCSSICPSSGVIAVGTSDGYLRCSNTGAGECFFQHKVGNNAILSALKLGPDGKLLVAGTSEGNATRWNTSKWEMLSTVSVPGSVTHISFHPKGESALLGSSKGEIRHWPLSEAHLSGYKLSMAWPVNGVSFHNNEDDVVVSVKMGYARVWRGPTTNPNLDFAAFRNNILLDFDLCDNGSRVVTSTQDGMIRLLTTDTGTQVSAYSAPIDGSRCLALSADGAKIASSSEKGLVTIWNAEEPPSDADISFHVGGECPVCLSFSPDGDKLLVCLEDEVGIWKLGTRVEKLGQVPSSGSRDASFSRDGQFLIVGNIKQTSIWDATGLKIVFDSAERSAQTLPLAEARNIIWTCGTSAHRMWPSSFRTSLLGDCQPQNATKLSVESIFGFIINQIRPAYMQFSDNVFVSSNMGQLSIFKFCK